MSSIDVEGLDLLNKELKKLSGNMQKNIAKAGLRAAGAVVRKAARSNLSGEYAKYKKAINVKLLKPKSPYKITAIVGGGVHKGKDKQTKEPVSTDFWFAHIVEFGTLGSRTKSLDPDTKRGPHKSPLPKGLTAQPFLRPAFDSNKTKMVKAFADKIWQRIKKEHIKK